MPLPVLLGLPTPTELFTLPVVTPTWLDVLLAELPPLFAVPSTTALPPQPESVEIATASSADP
jgi:hypothetical protein